MEHIQPLRKSASAVHAVLDDEQTWCGWHYMSNRVHNGQPVPLAFTTDKPLTCGRCARKMSRCLQLRMISRELSYPQIEKLLVASTRMLLED